MGRKYGQCRIPIEMEGAFNIAPELSNSWQVGLTVQREGSPSCLCFGSLVSQASNQLAGDSHGRAADFCGCSALANSCTVDR